MTKPEEADGGVKGSRASGEPRRIIAANISKRIRRVIADTMANTGGVETLCSRVFPATADQAARVREVVNDTVGGHPASSTICLLASELAANAIRHSGSRFFGLFIDRTSGGMLRVVVIDEGQTGFPSLHERLPLEAHGGRGLRIIDCEAQRWGIIRRPGTATAVWFEYPTVPPTRTVTLRHRPAGSDDPNIDAATAIAGG